MLSSSRLVARRNFSHRAFQTSAKNEAAFKRSRNIHRPEKDPHQMASDMVRDAPDARAFDGQRISGTEALQSITPEQKMRNYVTAFGLVTFCTGVWYYSIQSVGKADGGFDALQAEAQEVRDLNARKDAETIDAQDLADLDATVERMDSEGVDVMGDQNASIKDRKPLWKRVVFFWRAV
jgi:hypothetical protein